MHIRKPPAPSGAEFPPRRLRSRTPVAKNLIIVESPAKTRTLKKFLGRDWAVEASVGHIRDLPKKDMGLGPGFEPTYAVLATKKDVVKKLKEAAKKAKQIYLAPDPDREGEAIAWHIAEVLGDVEGEVHRVTFNEITKSAVLKALENKGKIDLNRVDAQQARRVIDRLMGFKLSPLLWDKLKRGLSAGRVQSVALKMVCERQAEIDAFNPEEYWIVGGRFAAQAPPEFAARLHQIDGKKARVGDGTQAASDREGPLGRQLQGRRHRAQGVEAAPLAPVHHQPPAAGGGAQVQLLGEAHDGHRAGPLRGQGGRRPRPDRSHHLYAYRLDARRGGSDRCRARDDRQDLRRRQAAAEAQRLCLEEGRAGRPRGDPPDLPRSPARGARALPRSGRAQALPPDLGALRRQPDAAGGLRRHPGRHRQRHLHPARRRQGDEERRLPGRLSGGQGGGRRAPRGAQGGCRRRGRLRRASPRPRRRARRSRW